MAKESTVWFIWSLDGCYLYTLWQLELREDIGEPSVPLKVEAYRDQISLYQGYGAERSSESPVCCDGRIDSWCTSGRSLVFSRSRFPPKGSDESMCLSDMVVGCVPPVVRCKCRAFLTWLLDVVLPWSNVSVEPCWHSCWMWFLPWSYVSVGPF